MKKTDLVKGIFLMKLRSQVSRFLRSQKTDIYLRVRMLSDDQNYHNYILTST